VVGFINFVKYYIYPHINLGNGCRNGRRNGRRNRRRNGCLYKAQKLIDCRAGSYNFFKGLFGCNMEALYSVHNLLIRSDFVCTALKF